MSVSVGNLKHLRYLNIRGTEIKHLPDSLCSLYNLQTLILAYCITELPINMGKLINLRHLDITETKLKEMPPHMGKLKNLIKLPFFVVGKHVGSNITELGELRHISGKLSISNLEKVHCTKDATLKDTQDVSELELKWEPSNDAEDSRIERNVLQQLCPHTNLKFLTIENYDVLRNWKYCFHLPPLGQLPALKELKIQGFDEVLGVGPEFYRNDSCMIKPFESLEYLSFADMPKLQEWVIFEGETAVPHRDSLGLVGAAATALGSVTLWCWSSVAHAKPRDLRSPQVVLPSPFVGSATAASLGFSLFKSDQIWSLSLPSSRDLQSEQIY
uniref:R13L1/DRL21-like LRR repeat region domain-containing protein n=1 Tax=Fagus sylvatica TaxID=28930 RepID=A0A2N9IY14_FAGSY